MTLSIWRYAHLTLALLSFIFLSMASITGSILAFYTIKENASPYCIHDLNRISIAQTLSSLQSKIQEISELEISEKSYVKLKGFDRKGEEVEGYINPKTGDILGKLQVNDPFIMWITSLHRSLFLHETGRILVGINSFLLFLIATSGGILILKRQKKFWNFFSKIKGITFSQYYHTLFGQLMLIPISIISITGSYLCMERFNFFSKNAQKIINYSDSFDNLNTALSYKDIPIFSQIKLSEVRKIEFPFSDDPDEYFIIKLKDKELMISPLTGAIISQLNYPISKRLATISLDLHTGRTHVIWAVILFISCLYILFFIGSGFTITWKRGNHRLKNKYTASESKIIILVGSENGSTFNFANSIHQQLISQNYISYLTELNKYQIFPKAEYILVLTSTYGMGEAPSNARKFETLVRKNPQNHSVKFCVLGFGSKSYDNFCLFAENIDKQIKMESWSEPILDLHTVNDKSIEEFLEWIKKWNSKTGVKLNTEFKFYRSILKNFIKLKIEQVYIPKDSKETFIVKINPGKKNFTSGDILAVYPCKGQNERYYSIAKVNHKIQISIKYYPSGLASEYLINRNKGDYIYGKIINNTSFHFPNKANRVVMIANGTGIGPFLGMIDQNLKKIKTYLYCGFRQRSEIIDKYKSFLEEQINKGNLERYNFSFSLDSENKYVMNLLQKDKDFLVHFLEEGGVIMICGALHMQVSVEKVLDEIVFENSLKKCLDYKKNGQILTDCY
jgi:sulfite reductase (NADPH) flavoprotein alpha-component